LKIAVVVGVMMSDPIGNLCYCFTPLVTYITDTPEQSLLACISPRASPVSTVIYKEFGDAFPHPPCTAMRTLDDIKQVCIEADPNDFEEFLKATKCYSLSSVQKPFWQDWLLSDPSKFLMLEVLHHFHHLFWDHDLQWCNNVLGSAKID
ncbi:hypothetical protein EDC04DRAFT_2526494, partial [Pisolithus marmoratus]